MSSSPLHWRNWAGNVAVQPRAIVRPRSVEEIVTTVRGAADRGERVRPVGAGHSFAPLCATDGTLVDLGALAGIDAIDVAARTATVLAGTRIHALGGPLAAAGLAFPNQGDIDVQAIAGAVATGTHGSGRGFGSYADQVVAIELATPAYGLVTIDGSDPERLRAAALSLGLLGVATRITFALEPAYLLRVRSRVLPFDECVSTFDEIEASVRNAEFFWLPAHDACVLKTFERAITGPGPVVARPPPTALPGTVDRYLVAERIDWSYRVFPSVRDVPFVELEYAVPIAAGLATLCELRDLMRTSFPEQSWAVEYRTLAGSDRYLSPTVGHASATISIHAAAEGAYERFFAEAEALFRAADGRPHWGKLTLRDPAELRGRYPEVDRFAAIRAQLDPGAMFGNRYLDNVIQPTS